MNIQRIAAFSDDGSGGNPAGVVIGDVMPAPERMQAVAAEVGYSETAFAAPDGQGWRVRYFAPEIEVPFCGHATIALGAALALAQGDGTFNLTLNAAKISVEGRNQNGLLSAAFQSPPTKNHSIDPALLRDALALFGYDAADLDPRIPPTIVDVGTKFMAIALKERRRLSEMRYDLAIGRTLMTAAGIATIKLAVAENQRLFHTRNPFAGGGVYEDPATGAATAAFTGYLHRLGWAKDGSITFIQGEDMGMRSRLVAEIPASLGGSVRVSGQARIMVL